jgi:hypothetical protein
MLHDLIAAYRAAVREFTRRRWLRQRTRNIHLPF